MFLVLSTLNHYFNFQAKINPKAQGKQEQEQEVAMHGSRPAKVVGGVGAMRSR